MPKKKSETPEVSEEAVENTPAEHNEAESPSLEETLSVLVAFSDEQLARIQEAGFEPASVRNEFGLAKMNKEPQITLTEAIARAKTRYAK